MTPAFPNHWACKTENVENGPQLECILGNMQKTNFKENIIYINEAH